MIYWICWYLFCNIPVLAIDSTGMIVYFFPIFPFDPPENIRKKLILMFSGGSKGNIGKARVKTNALQSTSASKILKKIKASGGLTCL